jgi:hypothetical protein
VENRYQVSFSALPDDFATPFVRLSILGKALQRAVSKIEGPLERECCEGVIRYRLIFTSCGKGEQYDDSHLTTGVRQLAELLAVLNEHCREQMTVLEVACEPPRLFAELRLSWEGWGRVMRRGEPENWEDKLRHTLEKLLPDAGDFYGKETRVFQINPMAWRKGEVSFTLPGEGAQVWTHAGVIQTLDVRDVPALALAIAGMAMVVQIAE